MAPANYSLHLVPLAWLLALLPRAYSILAYTTHSRAQNLATVRKDPRSFKALVAADKTLPPVVRDRIVRAESAGLNGTENIGLFAAAVVAGNAAGLETGWLNALAGGYVVTRAVYVPVFVLGDTVRLAGLRTGLFAVGTGCCLGLFVMAGVKVNSGE